MKPAERIAQKASPPRPDSGPSIVWKIRDLPYEFRRQEVVR
jgi:hypothetical protein